ncbi:MAG: DUF86 domain-containing protein [Thermoplasmata archaeon]|nr:DUF86 domain-containing protein [Thermoplasmata archaeon]
MLRNDQVLINDIRDSIREIFVIVENMEFDEFDDDRIRQLAVIRLLELIGEASNQVSDDFKKDNREIPWKEMISMRNRLIHGYFSVNTRIVWDTIRIDLPYLLGKLDETP